MHTSYMTTEYHCYSKIKDSEYIKDNSTMKMKVGWCLLRELLRIKKQLSRRMRQ